jgi:hypothetical protein
MTLGQLLELLGSWQEDPCWDLEGTDGLSPAQVPLAAAFNRHRQRLWDAETSITHQQQRIERLQEGLDRERALLELANSGLREHRAAAKTARTALLNAAHAEVAS